MQSDSVHPIPWSVGLRSLHTCRETDSFSSVITRRDHHQFTTSSRSDHTSLLGNGSRLGCGLSPLVLLSIYGRGQSFTVAQLPRRRLFLRRISKNASLDIEFIVRESSTIWSYTKPLPYTASALRTYTYDNKHTIQCVFCTSVTVQRSIYNRSGSETHGE